MMVKITRISIFLLIWAMVSTGTLLAQAEGDRPDAAVPQGENLEVPEGWVVKTDKDMPELSIGSDADSADIYFVNMTPGWHITTGPAGIYYHPANQVEGSYTLQASFHLFNTEGRDREAYGVFFGGTELDVDQQQYLYFLVRNTGDYLIKSRMGDETQVIEEWTASDAIQIYKEGQEEASVKNELRVQVGNELSFHVNGVEVARLSSEDFSTDGMYGLRVNHALNLHISKLSVEK